MTQSIDWTEDKIKRLKQLFDEGYSGAVMASELAVTRNAAIGKCNRMGWTRPTSKAAIMENMHKIRRATKRSHKKTYGPNSQGFNHHNYGGRAAKIQREAANREARVPLFEDRISEHDAAIPKRRRKTFWQLEPKHCRFPVGSGASLFFCGATRKDGSSYCSHHHARCWTPARRA